MRVISPSKAISYMIEGRAVNIKGDSHEQSKGIVTGIVYKSCDIGENTVIDMDEFVRACIGEQVSAGDELTAFTDGKFFKASSTDIVSYISWEDGYADQEDLLIKKAYGYRK